MQVKSLLQSRAAMCGAGILPQHRTVESAKCPNCLEHRFAPARQHCHRVVNLSVRPEKQLDPYGFFILAHHRRAVRIVERVARIGAHRPFHQQDHLLGPPAQCKAPANVAWAFPLPGSTVIQARAVSTRHQRRYPHLAW